MTLREELEILRGEPIQVWEGDPRDIPCIETSDKEQLCKHPVVSVSMITYNHEPYIRQAIEGVMMQKTDFEFELVIGEDCSTDKTREICFEYQKKYPDKIRILWCDHNLYRNPHPAGGNSRRNLAHCRGEFIAICEGDDYWIDPLKLQKQVDVMRKYPNVGFCFTGAKIYKEAYDRWSIWDESRCLYPKMIFSQQFLLQSSFGINPLAGPGNEIWQMTASFMFRASVYKKAQCTFEIFNWRMYIGDAIVSLGLAACADVYYIPDDMVVYRQGQNGETMKKGDYCGRDTMLVRYYYFRKIFGTSYEDIPDKATDWFVLYSLRIKDNEAESAGIRSYLRGIKSSKIVWAVFNRRRWLYIRAGLTFGISLRFIYRFNDVMLRFGFSRAPLSKKLFDLYRAAGIADFDVNAGKRSQILPTFCRVAFRRIKSLMRG